LTTGIKVYQPLAIFDFTNLSNIRARVEAKIDMIIPATNKPFDIPFLSDNAILS
jgi:hypothetical protein